jgi:hypothetical protein
MRGVGGWIVRKAVRVEERRAIDAGNARAKPRDAFRVGRVVRDVDQKSMRAQPIRA